MIIQMPNYLCNFKLLITRTYNSTSQNRPTLHYIIQSNPRDLSGMQLLNPLSSENFLWLSPTWYVFPGATSRE